MTIGAHHMEYPEFLPSKELLSKRFDADVMVLERPTTQSTRPPKFSITLFKSKNTKISFLVQILSTVFHKTKKEAKDILFQIEEKGSAVVGFYTKEIAETKVDVVSKLAELSQSSLNCKMQKE